MSALRVSAFGFVAPIWFQCPTTVSMSRKVFRYHLSMLRSIFLLDSLLTVFALGIHS